MERPELFSRAQGLITVKNMLRHIFLAMSLTAFAFGPLFDGLGAEWISKAWAEEEAAPEGNETKNGEGEDAAAGFSVRLHLLEGELPSNDPMDPVWDKVEEAEFPMSPQVHWPDRLLDATVKDVKVRGYHNTEQLAIMVEYQDPTEDPADAAALEFMVGDKKAHFAHGQEMLQVEGGPVNIWYWKNETGKAVDMTAKGFGTLKPQAEQDVSAVGAYNNGTWRVVFSRPLETSDKETDVQVVPGIWTSVAFAMWDGALTGTGEPKEKGSQKAISSWWSIRAEPPPDNSIYLYALLGLGIAAFFELALIWKLRKGQAA